MSRRSGQLASIVSDEHNRLESVDGRFRLHRIRSKVRACLRSRCGVHHVDSFHCRCREMGSKQSLNDAGNETRYSGKKSSHRNTFRTRISDGLGAAGSPRRQPRKPGKSGSRKILESRKEKIVGGMAGNLEMQELWQPQEILEETENPRLEIIREIQKIRMKSREFSRLACRPVDFSKCHSGELEQLPCAFFHNSNLRRRKSCPQSRKSNVVT